MGTEQLTCPFTATAAGERRAAYRELAAEPGVRRVDTPDGGQAWLVTGNAQVKGLFHDARLAKMLTPTAATAARLAPEIAHSLTQHMLAVDGADHARLRRLVNTAFTLRRVEDLTPRIQRIADDLLSRLEQDTAPGQVVDLLDVYAFPLPMTVICELVGVPERDRRDFRDWSNVMIGAWYAEPDAFRAAAAGMVDLVRELIAERRADPGEDLLSALVSARDGGDRLTEDELTSMVWVLVLAGHETTVNLIANGMYELLTHSGELRRLREHPELTASCVEELLRVASPVHTAAPLIARAPLEINGVGIAAGEVVLPALMAANHDPARIADPDTLDIGRADNAHLAFGHGAHYCLGAPLARLEGRIALRALVDHFPDLALGTPAKAVTWRPSYIINAPTALPVVLRPA
jgi:cytochrome P450